MLISSNLSFITNAYICKSTEVNIGQELITVKSLVTFYAQSSKFAGYLLDSYHDVIA